MNLGNGLGHLTYSTLVHPGDTWDDMWQSLTTYVPQVKSRVCPDAPFGVSLRLSNASAETLVGSAIADGGDRWIVATKFGHRFHAEREGRLARTRDRCAPTTGHRPR